MTLAEYLRQSGQSLAAFAAEVGVSEASMSRYATGKRVPRKQILQRITAATGGKVQANDLLGTEAAAPEDALGWLEAYPEIEAVDLILSDLNGILRGKRVPRDVVAKVIDGGIRLAGSVYSLDSTGENTAGTGLVWSVGDKDQPVVPATGLLHPSPWTRPPTAQMLMSMRDDDGGPFWAEPRTILAQVADKVRELDVTPVIALELEFYLIDPKRDETGRPQPPISPVSGRRDTATQVYGLEALEQFGKVLGEITDACAAQNVPADAAVAEYAPGQYEVNLHHVPDPLTACDHALLLKRTVKGVAAANGLEATFMARPYAEHAGSGLHAHLSLIDNQGQNLFDGGGTQGPAMVSDRLRHAVGGLCETMAEAMAIFAPNGNSYRRLRPGSYAPLSPAWGVDNRTVALRIPGGPGNARRIEHRVAGADANLYLTVAAILAGLHHGIANRIEPPEPMTGNAYDQLEPSLPTRWPDALDLFDGSTVLRQYLGDRFCNLFATCKRGELTKFEAHISDLEHAWYL